MIKQENISSLFIYTFWPNISMIMNRQVNNWEPKRGGTLLKFVITSFFFRLFFQFFLSNCLHLGQVIPFDFTLFTEVFFFYSFVIFFEVPELISRTNNRFRKRQSEIIHAADCRLSGKSLYILSFPGFLAQNLESIYRISGSGNWIHI